MRWSALSHFRWWFKQSYPEGWSAAKAHPGTSAQLALPRWNPAECSSGHTGDQHCTSRSGAAASSSCGSLCDQSRVATAARARQAETRVRLRRDTVEERENHEDLGHHHLRGIYYLGHSAFDHSGDRRYLSQSGLLSSRDTVNVTRKFPVSRISLIWRSGRVILAAEMTGSGDGAWRIAQAPSRIRQPASLNQRLLHGIQVLG